MIVCAPSQLNWVGKTEKAEKNIGNGPGVCQPSRQVWNARWMSRFFPAEQGDDFLADWYSPNTFAIPMPRERGGEIEPVIPARWSPMNWNWTWKFLEDQDGGCVSQIK